MTIIPTFCSYEKQPGWRIQQHVPLMRIKSFKRKKMMCITHGNCCSYQSFLVCAPSVWPWSAEPKSRRGDQIKWFGGEWRHIWRNVLNLCTLVRWGSQFSLCLLGSILEPCRFNFAILSLKWRRCGKTKRKAAGGCRAKLTTTCRWPYLSKPTNQTNSYASQAYD